MSTKDPRQTEFASHEHSAGFMMPSVRVSHLRPFAAGWTRQCFVHPDEPTRCIKITRPDATDDDNQTEWQYRQSLHRRGVPIAAAGLTRCYGWIRTDRGPGLQFDLIREPDGRIASSVDAWLATNGRRRPALSDAFTDLRRRMADHRIIMRDARLSNVVVQSKADGSIELWVVDGLGDRDARAFASRFCWSARWRQSRLFERHGWSEALTHPVEQRVAP